MAVLIVLAAGFLRWMFLSELGARVAFLTFYPAVSLAALYGGLRAGVAATLLSALLAKYFWMPSVGAFGLPSRVDQLALAIFVLGCFMVCWTAELYKRADRARWADASRRAEVERLVIRRTAELVETTNALQAEISVRRSLEERFRQVFESAPNAMIIIDGQGVIELVNAKTEQVFGSAREELLGRTIDMLLPERLRGAHLAHRHAFLAAPTQRAMGKGRDLFARRKDGTEFPFEIGLSPLQTSDGVKVVSSIVDISKRNDMERALSESEERMRLMLDSIQDHAIVMLDTEGHIVSWNAGAQRLTGYGKDEVLGRRFSLLYLPDDLEAEHAERALIVAAAEGRFEKERRSVRKDGFKYLANVVINAVRDPRGELRGFVKVTRDITQAKRIESQWIEANRRFALASGAARLGFWELEVETRSLSWDKQMFELYGLPASEGPQPQAVWANHLHGEDRASAEAKVRLAIENDSDFEIEYRIVRPDGGVRHLRSAATVQRDAEGRATHLFGVNFDITERKQLEASLIETNERFALAAEAAGMGFYDLDVETEAGRWDEQMYRLFGVSPEGSEDPYALWKKGVHPDDLGVAEAGIREAITRLDAYKYEFRIVRPDGEVRHMRGASAVKRDPATGRRRLFGLSFDVTERKRIETERIESNERFAVAADAAGLGFWEWRIAADTVRWDDQMFRIRGSAPVAGNYAADRFTYVHPDDKARVDRELRDAAEGRKTFDSEYRIVLADGRVRHMKSAAKLKGEPGAADARLLGVSFDITERKEIEERLIQSNLRFALAAEAAELGFWEYDMKAQTLRWDDQMFRLYGVTRRDGAQPYELWTGSLHPDDRSRAEREVTAAASDGRKFDTEFRIVWPDGGVRHLRAAATLICDSKTDAARMFGVNFDITERKQIENKLLEANERFALAAEAAGLGFWEFDIEKQTSHWDDQMYRLYGIERGGGDADQQALRRSLMHADDRVRIDELLAQAISGVRSFEAEYRIFQPEGRLRHMRSAASPKRDAAGRAVRLLGVSFDVTERKEALEALEQARDAAQAANRAKSDFLAVMSHEIRTPMNGVMGMNALLLETKLTKRQRRMIVTIQESAESLLTIIDDVLDISKLEAGKIDLEEVDFDLLHLIHKIVELFAPRAAQKQLSTAADTTAVSRPALHGDASRLRQILLNLVSNAIKFTASGSVTVTAVTTDIGSSQTRLRVQVRDTGPGVGEDAKTRLFEPFEQADSSIRRRFGGTGLGLSICRRLVERMGGEIGVADGDGGGSVFWFEVLLRRAATEIPEVPSQPAATAALETPVRSGRILLAEDNAMNIEIAKTILERAGYSVDVAVDGNEAVRVVRQRRYDLVLMDMYMPHLDGLAATREIRAFEGDDARVPIVAMTANAMQADQRRCLEAGMDDYLSKPFQPARLVEKVAQWIGQIRSPAEPSIQAPPTGVEALPVVDADASEKLLSCFPRQRFNVLLRRFLSELEKDKELFPRLALSSSLPEMGQDAHKLIASAGHFGARQVQKLAKDLQYACDAGDAASVSALVEQLVPASAAAAAALLAKYPLSGRH